MTTQSAACAIFYVFFSAGPGRRALQTSRRASFYGALGVSACAFYDALYAGDDGVGDG